MNFTAVLIINLIDSQLIHNNGIPPKFHHTTFYAGGHLPLPIPGHPRLLKLFSFKIDTVDTVSQCHSGPGNSHTGEPVPRRCPRGSRSPSPPRNA